MNKNPKIMVFQLKELIYTTLFVLLTIILIILLIKMFKDNENTATNANPESYEITLHYDTSEGL